MMSTPQQLREMLEVLDEEDRAMMILNCVALVISVGLLLSFSRFLFPGFYQSAPDWLQPVVAAPLVVGLIGALLLNLVFRIGIKKSATIVVAPGADAQVLLRRLIEFDRLAKT